MKQLFITVSLFSVLTACNESGKKKDTDSTAGTIKYVEGIDLQINMRETDSVQAIFYDDPDGDPERYTRFFKYTATTDTGFIRPLLRSIRQPFREYQAVKDCRSEGKAYLFKKGNDNPLQTIYFSTRCDSCCYVYFIKNGKFYYMNMTDELAVQLQQARSKSIVPKAQT
jgi:hypothetical protein